MIIQGTNIPITLIFDRGMGNIKELHALLYVDKSETEIKHWTKSSVIIDEEVVQLPITEQESLAFPVGKARLEVKFVDADDTIHFTKVFRINISDRVDEHRMVN